MREYFSKEGQDIFVLSLIKKPGFFLDIGCAEPLEGNNTYALERHGWRGILLDSNKEAVSRCKWYRSSRAYTVDATSIDWKELLEKHHMPKAIDYISMDVDDANIQVIQNFPFDEYEFKIMTFETDNYNNDGVRQQAAKEVLSKYPQYELLLENAQLEDGKTWEDWWINTKYFDSSVLSLKSKDMYWKDFLKKLK